MFLFKKKKIVVDAMTINSAVGNLFPIKKCSEFIPSWWKSMPSTYKVSTDHGIDYDASTIKRCDGILQYYKHGFMIPLWSDLIIKTAEDGSWAWKWSDDSDPMDIVTHNRKQFSPVFDNFIHLKINSPWVLLEKTGVKFEWSQPVYNDISNLNKYIIPPAVIDFKYNCGTNINMLLSNKNEIVHINAGEPLVKLVPISDYDVTIKTHIVSLEEYIKHKNFGVYNFSFRGKYKKRKQIMNNSKSKCPFGFGS